MIEPVIVYPAKCARPAKPDLPKLAGLNFLENREAYSRIRLRDSVMRSYIAGLEDALDCYEAQLPRVAVDPRKADMLLNGDNPGGSASGSQNPGGE